ncbi:hypothetical protein REPUB_Repub08aG0157800 [Reevesia pubescens]
MSYFRYTKSQGKKLVLLFFSHVLREGNFSANALAKSDCSMDLDFEVLRDPPNFMVALIQVDKLGVQYPRGFKILYFSVLFLVPL